jgi:methylmalonyl-CoA/ethylmalonyl-CoA epimerase
VLESDARVAHIGIAVPALADAVAFYRDVLRLEPSPPVTTDGAVIVSLHLGDVEVELMEPVTPDGPVAKFIQKRGPGIHHICFRVPDLERALDQCRRLGYQLVDEAPRPGAGARRVAFIHPKSTGGILLELTE